MEEQIVDEQSIKEPMPPEYEGACLHGKHNWFVQSWPSGARSTLCLTCGLLSHYEPPTKATSAISIGVDEGHGLLDTPKKIILERSQQEEEYRNFWRGTAVYVLLLVTLFVVIITIEMVRR